MGNRKGFTLIEMMVVVAVVGILSAAVLAGLGPSRARAKDARVISGMQQIRSIAETFYNGSNGKYDMAALQASGDFKRASDDVKNNTKGSQAPTVQPATESNYYLIHVQLNSGKFYCVDSSGNAGEYGSAPSGTACLTSP